MNFRNLPIYMTLFFGIGFRYFQAFHTIEILHPDEHFQVLEPAARAAWGIGWTTWEWTEGLRSWVTPTLFLPFLKFLSLLGLQGGPSSIYLCRTVVASLSTAFLLSFWTLLKDRRLSPLSQWLVVSIAALEPAWIRFGSATLTDTLAMDFLWLAMPWISRLSFSKSSQRVALAGFLLGLPFLFRIQMAMFAAGFLIPFAWASVSNRTDRKGQKKFFALILGFSSVVFIQGVVDWLTWGRFLGSVLTNIQRNLIDQVSSTYGVEPWSFYLTHSPTEYGGVFVLLLPVSLLGAAFIITQGVVKRTQTLDLAIFSGTLFYTLIHTLIPHKESRFLYPILPGFLYLAAVCSDSVFSRIWAKKPPRALFHFLTALTILLSIPIYRDIIRWDAYPISNMSNLMLTIFKDGALKRSPDKCVLLLGQYWIWTHGEFLQGIRYQYIEASVNEIESKELLRCPYLIVLPQLEAQFAAKASNQFRLLDRNPRGYALYARNF